MKDSQDWLDKIIKEILLVDNAALYELGGSGAIAVEDLKRVKNKYIKRCKQEVRKHILQEALEIVDATKGWVTIEDYDTLEMCEAYELRNKFNDKYKED